MDIKNKLLSDEVFMDIIRGILEEFKSVHEIGVNPDGHFIIAFTSSDVNFTNKVLNEYLDSKFPEYRDYLEETFFVVYKEHLNFSEYPGNIGKYILINWIKEYVKNGKV